MKRIALAGLAAICLIAVSQQQASAWVNNRFSIGLTWHRQSGGNNLGWGAWRNGQPPGPESFAHGPFSPSTVPYYGGTPAQPNHAYPQTAEPAYAGQNATPFTFASQPRQTYYYYPAPAYYYYYPAPANSFYFFGE
jgi:hypothetical protein